VFKRTVGSGGDLDVLVHHALRACWSGDTRLCFNKGVHEQEPELPGTSSAGPFLPGVLVFVHIDGALVIDR